MGSTSGRATRRLAKKAEEDKAAADQDAEAIDGKLPIFLAFLVDPYNYSCFWFEVAECLRKLTLIGVLLFYRQGTVAQLLVGLLISLGSALMYTFFQPFKARADNIMAMACEVSIFAALLSSLVLDHGEALAAGDVKTVEALLIFLIAFPLAAIGPLSLWQLANEGGFDSLTAISQRLSVEAISKRISEAAASKGSSGAPPLAREERASSTQQPTQSHSSV